MLTKLATAANSSWRAAGLQRKPASFSHVQGAHATINNRRYLVFSSSDYLGLGQHPTVLSAASAAMARLGAGATGSRLTTGTTDYHLAAERDIAAFVGTEEAVFFATGYQTNLSTLQALAALAPGLEIFSDQLNHASIIDGCRIARTPVHVFNHCDVSSLEHALATSSAPHRLVVTDGLFSMDGDLAPYPQLLDVCRDHNAWLLVDDAHAIGTIGPGGRGLAAHSTSPLPEVLIVTGSKALGAEGGFACCSHELATYLRNHARSYVFSTATPPATPAAISAALSLVEDQLAVLRANLNSFHELTGTTAPEPTSPIIPIPVGAEEAAVSASEQLKRAGLWVPAIRYPTVGAGRAILRVTITALHTKAQVEQLAEQLHELSLLPVP
ncbi:8-amino-7-oxononanoate synthase [Staphylococcus chromogenes]|nr:8-amino-7-oxononanoate synthase [Staphylococcus chromogenes]